MAITYVCSGSIVGKNSSPGTAKVVPNIGARPPLRASGPGAPATGVQYEAGDIMQADELEGPSFYLPARPVARGTLVTKVPAFQYNKQ